MSTIIVIDGGVGRVAAAIPALLKYHKNHPEEEWYVMVHGWDFMFWGFPELQERAFNPNDKAKRVSFSPSKIYTVSLLILSIGHNRLEPYPESKEMTFDPFFRKGSYFLTLTKFPNSFLIGNQ